jgi:NADH-quinone oxidoreductase subunit B
MSAAPVHVRPEASEGVLPGMTRRWLWLWMFACGCSVQGPKYDLARFGAEVPRFSPRQSDLLMIVGTITEKQGPALKRVFEQMTEPK